MTRDPKRTVVYDKPERFSEKDIEALYAQVADTTVTDGVVFEYLSEQACCDHDGARRGHCRAVLLRTLIFTRGFCAQGEKLQKKKSS